MHISPLKTRDDGNIHKVILLVDGRLQKKEASCSLFHSSILLNSFFVHTFLLQSISTVECSVGRSFHSLAPPYQHDTAKKKKRVFLVNRMGKVFGLGEATENNMGVCYYASLFSVLLFYILKRESDELVGCPNK